RSLLSHLHILLSSPTPPSSDLHFISFVKIFSVTTYSLATQLRIKKTAGVALIHDSTICKIRSLLICCLCFSRYNSSNVLPSFSRSEENTSELQSRFELVCSLLI